MLALGARGPRRDVSGAEERAGMSPAERDEGDTLADEAVSFFSLAVNPQTAFMHVYDMELVSDALFINDGCLRPLPGLALLMLSGR